MSLNPTRTGFFRILRRMGAPVFLEERGTACGEPVGDIVAEHGLEEIKTIGDAYMAAGGLPVSAADHAVRCVRAGLALTRLGRLP